MRVWVLVLTAAGCNQIYGLEETRIRGSVDADPRVDLDRDDIADIEDSCIAPQTDALGDDDDDAIENAMDPCPFDPGATTDGDGDGIPDACDPIPRAGDRLRCLMTFSDPDLDLAMWKPRDQSGAWTRFGSGALSVVGKGSIAADWPFEGGPSTTYDVAVSIGSAVKGQFAVLARAAATPMPSDAGCELEVTSDGALVVRALPGTGGMPVVGVTLPSRVRIRVTFAPSGPAPNLRCTFRFGATAPITVAANASFAEGRLGFDSDNANVTVSNMVEGVAIYERADAATQ